MLPCLRLRERKLALLGTDSSSFYDDPRRLLVDEIAESVSAVTELDNSYK